MDMKKKVVRFMKQYTHRWTGLLLAACLLSILLSLPAFAKEKEKIDKIPLFFLLHNSGENRRRSIRHGR